jgi:4-amino-4-deoxy-L-arabinose transferase-like glycosyltransferase
MLALLAMLSVGVGVFDHELWPPTEQAMAGVTWEMYRSDDLLVPKIDGLAYLEKPPLAYALSWLAFKTAGHASAGLLRLPAALAGFASLLTVLAIAWRLHGEAVAWISALICALTINFFGIMHRASTDSIAVFFTFLCFALFMRTLAPPAERDGPPHPAANPHLGGDIAFCLALAVSFLVKNFYTYLVVVPPVTAFLIWRSEYRRLVRMGLLATLALAIVVVPWAYALYARGGSEYLRVVFFDNTFGRLMNIGPPTGAHLPVLDDAFVVHKHESLLTGLRALVEEMLPWIFLYSAALATLLRKPASNAARAFLLIALCLIPLCLTLSAARVESYYRPVIFVLVLLAADYLRGVFSGASARWEHRLIAANFWLVALLITAAPLAVGRYLNAPAIARLALPFALGLGWLAWRQRGASWHEPQMIQRSAVFVATCFILMLGMTYPELDTRLSWRPFFDAVHDTLDERRELWTTIVDDRKLPAMTFYFDRRVRLAEGPAAVPALLAGSQPVGVIVPIEQADALERELCAIPHRTLRADIGRDLFVYVTNSPAANGGLLSQRLRERCAISGDADRHVGG